MSRQPCAHEITTLCSRGRIQEAFYLVCRGYREGFFISRDVVYSLLQACTIKKDIKLVRKMHGFMVNVGVHWISSLGDHVMRHLGSFGCLFEASLVFCQIMNPTTYTWNAILEAHSHSSIEEKAIFLYYEMQENGIEPDEVSFLILLKACMSLGDVKQGVLMHHEITWSVFLPNVNTVNAILDMYAKFGRLDEARNIFDSLPDRDAASWGAMFSGYAQHSHSLLIFQFYKEMENECVKPSKASFLSFLSACSDMEGAKEGRFIHDKIARSEFASDVGIGNAMVVMYVKCRCLNEAFKVFKELPFPDILSWSALITGFSLGYGEFVLRLFEELLQKGLNLTKGICLNVLKACESKESTEIFYDKLIRHSFELDIVVGSALIDVYGKLDLLQEAENVFDRLKCSHNGLTWRKIISSYNEQSRQRSPLIHLLNLIKHEGVEPGKFLLHCILNTCGQMTVLTQGRFLHYLIVRSDLSSDALLNGSLIVMYVKCSSFEDAYNLFRRWPYNQDNRSWHPLIGEYIENRYDRSVLRYVLRMQEAGMEPCKASFLVLLELCIKLHSFDTAALFHDQIMKMGLESDKEIADALVELYARYDSLSTAYQGLDKLPCPDARSYRATIVNYPHQRQTSNALDNYISMQANGIMADRAIFMEVLKACGSGETLSFGRLVHYSIVTSGFVLDVAMGTILVNMYSRLGELEDAQKVFDTLSEHNVVSWCTLITGYSHHGQDLLALEAYAKMQETKIKPDEIILSRILKVCANLGAMELGRLLNDHIVRSGVDSNVVIGSILVDMYAKSSSLQEAQRVFKNLSNQNIVTWGGLLTGYASEGDYASVDRCLVDMERQGLTPDVAIFVTLITVCSHCGFLEEGSRYFNKLREAHDDALLIFEHYNCMVDLLGHLGYLENALDLLCTMPTMPDGIGWKSLITGCKTYGNADLGNHCFNRLSELVTNDASGYTIMSNIYVNS